LEGIWKEIVLTEGWPSHFTGEPDKMRKTTVMINDVRFEVFTAVTMKNGVFWDVTPYGSCKNRRFGVTYRLIHQGDKNR
jgi:hypothetical protein